MILGTDFIPNSM